MTKCQSNLHDTPLDAMIGANPAVLALIVGAEGPSYRPVGAGMVILKDGTRIGSLSSGCIEADIALHAQSALDMGTAHKLRYGIGSPFVDIQLPCGGGLDILLTPQPDQSVVSDCISTLISRKPYELILDTKSGAFNPNGDFSLLMQPLQKFLVFGKGPEAWTFANLVQSAGYHCTLVSPDQETLDSVTGCDTHHITAPYIPDDIKPDAWTSVTLFFHDHEWEPPILAAALETDAFYIGAQGSLRTRDRRLSEMSDMGIPETAFSRLHGPIGLVPSARDARTLAVSVLAEILASGSHRK